MTAVGSTEVLLRLPLPDGLTEPQARSVADKLVYSSESVVGVELRLADRELHVAHRHGEEEHVSRLVAQLADEAAGERIRGVRRIRATDPVVLSGSAEPEQPAATFAVLHRAYDRMFLDLARRFGASERVYPAIIELSTMDVCRYVELFPQNAYLVDEFPHEREALTRMRLGQTGTEAVRRSSQHMLNPALCFHTYGEYRDTVVSEPLVLTVSGQCFRHEAPWRLNRFRRANFTMREIPYAGTASEVSDLRDALLEETWNLFVGMGFHGRVETATDPFYHPQDSMVRQHQLMANMKYELVVETPLGNSSAIASFNNVFDSLCKQFGITTADGRSAHSGCAAYGIDRWVQATLDQHGADPSGWPAQLREHVG